MSNKTIENWKEVLLKSGIPLESSVRSILEGMSFEDILEYNFLRKNDNDIINNFSVDIHARKRIAIEKNFSKNFYLEYLLECKYCTPDSHWIFMPSSNSYTLENPSLYVDAFDNKLGVNLSYLESICNEYKVAGKGFSLRFKNSDSTQIKEAHNQLAYAYIHRYFEKLSWDSYNAYFLFPIIVTTANLWRLKDNVKVEDIYKANDLEDVCERYNVLRYQSDPDRLMINYFKDKYNSLDNNIKSKLTQKYCRNYNGSIEEFIDDESTFVPGTFFIMNYDSFEKEFKNFDGKLSTPLLIRERHNAK